jgi:hypothetical protein
MSGPDLIFLGALVIMGVGFAAMAVVFPLWFVLHRVLARFDDDLLREPFFTKSEQINCLVWPFNYWKTGIYFTLIAAPDISRRKRFKGLKETPRVSKATTIACKIQVALMGFCGILFIVYAGYLVFGLYIYPRL